MSKTDTILCSAGEAITAYRFVTVESGDSYKVDMADAAGEKCLGVATAAAADDGEVLVAVAGYTLVDFAEAANLGDEITTDASGKAILADTTGHNILGFYAPEPVDGVSPAIASGQRGRVYLYANKMTLAL